MYTGHLLYEEEDNTIEVRSLIVRDREVAFDFITTWDKHGKWHRTGTARKLSTGEFKSAFESSKHVPSGTVGSRSAISLSFVVHEDSITVSGYWEEDGEMYRFGGSLSP